MRTPVPLIRDPGAEPGGPPLGDQERVAAGALVAELVGGHARPPIRAGRAYLGSRHERIQIQLPGGPQVEAALPLGGKAEAERL
eukprot:647326-Alexandrium_andersonii.AAC.1